MISFEPCPRCRGAVLDYNCQVAVKGGVILGHGAEQKCTT